MKQRERQRAIAAATKRALVYIFRYIGNLAIFSLTVGPLDVYAAADIDVACTVIHGHLVGLAHRVRHHKMCPAPYRY